MAKAGVPQHGFTCGGRGVGATAGACPNALNHSPRCPHIQVGGSNVGPQQGATPEVRPTALNLAAHAHVRRAKGGDAGS